MSKFMLSAGLLLVLMTGLAKADPLEILGVTSGEPSAVSTGPSDVSTPPATPPATNPSPKN